MLITANNLYYPVQDVPEFWTWIKHHSEAGRIKMPLETFEEVTDGSKNAEVDHLFAWISDDATKRALILDEQVNEELVQSVIRGGYANDLTDYELEQLGRDPFLIAYALAVPGDRCVVTTEVSAPAKQRQNRKIPDVCTTLGVQSCDTFSMLRALKFSTNWRAALGPAVA